MVTVRAPATTANLGPGFDCLGMALQLFNLISMDFCNEGLQIDIKGEGQTSIPRDHTNIVYLAALKVFESVGLEPAGLRIFLENEIPVARGLGSSAAAIVGGVVAANQLAGNKLSKDQLLQIANSFEGHPDNITPAMFGGLVIASGGSSINYYRFLPPANMKVIVSVPDYKLATKKAREVLPKSVAMEDAVFNISRMGFLIAAFATGNLALIARGMEDRLHQPYRSKLIPGMEDVFQAAKREGALAVALSGAGPTLIAFTEGETAGIISAMSHEFLKNGIKSKTDELRTQTEGTEIIDDGGMWNAASGSEIRGQFGG